MNFCVYTTLGQGQEMTLTFNTHISSYIQLVSAPTNFQVTGCNNFLKNPLFSLFPLEKPKLPNLTLPLNRSRSTQGHHLYKNFVELESSMLHAKFQYHRTSGSGEEDFFKVF